MTAKDKPLVQVRHLKKYFPIHSGLIIQRHVGAVKAVDDVTFDIQEGEIFSLLGPNGAGKTTTISMLSTLYEPTSGDATVAGHSVRREPMAVVEDGSHSQPYRRCQQPSAFP